MNVVSLLPDLDDLLRSTHLSEQPGLKGNPTFEYLMRAGYEHIEHIINTSRMDTTALLDEL